MLFSEIDQKLIIEWTYNEKFSVLLFILETLTALKSELSVDFTYGNLLDLDFSAVTFEVQRDFNFFATLIEGFGFFTGRSFDSIMAKWNIFASALKIELR